MVIHSNYVFNLLGTKAKKKKKKKRTTAGQTRKTVCVTNQPITKL